MKSWPARLLGTAKNENSLDGGIFAAIRRIKSDRVESRGCPSVWRILAYPDLECLPTWN